MPANGLLLIAPVRAGMEESLRTTLNRLGNDIRGVRTPDPDDAARIEFTRSESIHFARLTLIDDPDREPGRKRLLFATDYDGSRERHVREVIALTQHPEAIWGCCEGYAGTEQFPEFVRRYTVAPATYYIAFRGGELGEFRYAIRLREDYHAWMADPRAGRVLRAWPALRFMIESLRWFVHLLSRPFDFVGRGLIAVAEVMGLMARMGIREVLGAALQINATLNRVWWIRIGNVLFRNRPTAPPHRYSQAEPHAPPNPTPPGYPPEDAVLQNQLTLLTEVRPEHRARLRAVLTLIDLHGRRLSPAGSLVGISTIHTVRWTLLDGDRRLLMVSNYDGTWENYIDEFAEMILSGLDALWSSAPDYPRAGAQDVAALKQFLRRHQAPANVFYSAYPETSVLNLNDDLEFGRWFGSTFQRLTAGRVPNEPATRELSARP
jgi:hypothetical protein